MNISLRLVRGSFFVLALWLFAGPAAAEIYKWTDEQGRVHYSDQKPTGQEFEQVEVQVNSYESVSYGTVDTEATESMGSATSNRSKRVTIFSAEWCGYCKQAINYFRMNNIPITEYDIDKSRKGKRLYKKLGATGVHVILVGRKRMNGFSEAAFANFYQ